ncbi:hypothetical protein ED208_12480 [Stagnimonas aquatica]|uniref:Uncharacterized protein n=1 Tax=Stagnimonas aquatica TaxID=2689987 RepID=A0A3N0V8E7_9GAMM|nr:hypothetical protein ED208_12480 [Stagnimonas aquatica]
MLGLRGTPANSAPYRRLRQAPASIPPETSASRRYEGDRNIYSTAVFARRHIYSRRALRSREVGGADEPVRF